jgi:predicted phosphodiesterase
MLTVIARPSMSRVAWPSILGNHEAMLLDATQLSARDDAYQLRATAAQMSPALRAQIEAWPVVRTIETGAGSALLMHGSPTDLTFGYVYPDTDLRQFEEAPGVAGATVFMGNTHRPFVRRSGSTTFVNVGSCGLPRDVGVLGACCIFDGETGVARILRFDIADATARALARCGPVHDLVANVIARRTDTYVGELVAL